MTVAMKNALLPIETVGANGLTLTEMGIRLNATPLLATPPTVTTAFPDVVPTGTGATIDTPAVQLVGLASVPLKATVLVPWLRPKFVPEIVTIVLGGPEVGLKLEILGVRITVKVKPLLAIPPTVTITLPVVAPAGTGTEMLPGLQLVGVAVAPLKVTVLVP